MTGVEKYSLWLMPEGSVYDDLSGVIHRLSEQYGTPSFEPHVTLLGNLDGPEAETLSNTKQLAGVIEPFTLNVGTVRFLDEYSRSLFVEVVPTDELLAANKSARQVYGTERDEPFYPHLSLLYGHLSSEVKRRIVSTMGRDFRMRFGVRSVHLFVASSSVAPEDWHRVKEFRLGATAGSASTVQRAGDGTGRGTRRSSSPRAGGEPVLASHSKREDET